jgi:CheY-like chemotaxis protein
VANGELSSSNLGNARNSACIDGIQHASTGTQALLLIVGSHYDAIFVDVTLPDMSGFQLVESMTRVAPELLQRVIFMTGGNTQPIRTQYPQNTVLEKPFDIGLVRSLLTTAAAATE